MAEYINKSNAIDIMDDLWNRAGNNSRDFYLRLRKAIYDLSTEEINNKDVLLINIKTSINDFITELQENAKYHADFIKDNVDLVVFGAEEALRIVEETIEKYENV